MKTYTLLLLLALCAVLPAAEITPALRNNGNPPPGFRGFESGGKPMVYLNAEYGQFGSAAIRFDGGPGEYVIDLDVTAPEADSAAVGFYLLFEDGRQQMIRERQTAAPGKIEHVRLSAVAAKPVKGLAVKKMDAKKAPSVAVGGVTVNFTPEPQPVAFELGHSEEFRIAGLEVPADDRVEYEGAVGTGPAAGRGTFSWSTLKLNRRMPAGTYDFDGEVLIPAPDCVRVALYAIGQTGRHMPIGKEISGGKPGKRRLTVSFSAAEPFSALAVKKMEARQAPPAALGDFKLTMAQERRLGAAREIFRYPAPFGIRSAGLVRACDEAGASNDAKRIRKQAVEAEAWLDRAAAVADAEAEFRELRRAAATLPAPADAQAAERASAAARTAVNDAETAVFRQAAADFHAALNRAAGGEVSPDYGSDILGWVKNFEAVTKKRFPEYGEPTPYRIAGPEGIVLSFRRPDGSGEFESGRTFNRYRCKEAEYLFSVLTPVMTVDAAGTGLTADAAGITGVEKNGNGVFIASGKKTARLAIIGKSLRSVTLENGKLQIGLSAPGRVGLFFCEEKNAPEAAKFYLARLDSLPLWAVQIQRGNRIEQRVFDSNGRKAGYFPVSPLLMLGLGSPYPPQTAAKFGTTPDGFPTVAGNPDSFEYILAEGRPRRSGVGVNLFDKMQPGELYTELKTQGCGDLRLACGTATKWDWEKPELMRDALLHNLELARKNGLRIGIDLHGGWTPGREFGKIGSDTYTRELVRRWKTIIDWAKPYRDNLAWYDLINEPRIFFEGEPVKPYWEMVRRILPELRAADPATPFLVEVANMANPVGAWHYEPLPDGNVILGFHDYWPHMFTHQRVPDGGSEGMPTTVYPGFMPMIDWAAPSWRNTSPHWYYWDRWKADAVSCPVYRMLAKYGVAADCGEFGVVGYAGAARNSGRIWLEDALRRFRKMGISSEVWGVNGGYVWNVPHFRETILENWKREAKSPEKAGRR